MIGQEIKRNALVPLAAHSPTQVHSAGRHLAIVAKLNQNLARTRLVAILKRIAPEDAVAYLSSMQAPVADLIEQFADHWDWGRLSLNTVLPWSLELIKRFEDRWIWEAQLDYYSIRSNKEVRW